MNIQKKFEEFEPVYKMDPRKITFACYAMLWFHFQATLKFDLVGGEGMRGWAGCPLHCLKRYICMLLCFVVSLSIFQKMCQHMGSKYF